MYDTIKSSTTIYLQEPIENVTVTSDSTTGTTNYQLQIEDQNLQIKDKQPILYTVVHIIIGLSIVGIWLLIRKRLSKKASRYNQFKQSDIYKLMHEKGYYSANKKPVFEAVNEQETNELSETVLKIFASFSNFLKNSDLNEKDLQFCCLVKSRLTTLELSEIYCVSQSAIFKRKQKIKELLGFKSDKRTLDAIFEGM
ncbi:MAG: hypothetical protein SPK72_02380 [Bacteroidales bacterium]|nr:hypothetical protein [Bacteroidales bacterium]